MQNSCSSEVWRVLWCLPLVAVPLLAAEPDPGDSGIPHLPAADAQAAVLQAAETLQGLRSQDGTLSLLRLDLQKNTLAGILHNLLGRELAKRSAYWQFRPRGAAGSDLLGRQDEPLDLKTSSSLEVKGNQVSRHRRYYLVVHFTVYPEVERLAILWIRGGALEPQDWRRPRGTQWAFLSARGEARLTTIWKDFGARPVLDLDGIGEQRAAVLAGAGILTVRDFAQQAPERLQELLGLGAEPVRRAWEQARALAEARETP